MKSKINLAAKRSLWPILAAQRSVWRKTTYLHETGWIASLKRGYPCDKDGVEVPWMNYSVIAILKERLNKNIRLFEYGCGYSTLFYSKRVRDVIALEYDKVWLDHIKQKSPENVQWVYKANDIDGEYCRAITEFDGMFDVVIVDGRDRVNCVVQSVAKLSESGVILLDDSSRERYAEALEFAHDAGFRALNIEGLKPTGRKIDRTTLFYRDGNCLGL